MNFKSTKSVQVNHINLTEMTNSIRVLFAYVVEPSEKSVEIMRKFSEQYARRSGTYFCMDKGVTSVVIKVLSFPFHIYFNDHSIAYSCCSNNLYSAFPICTCMFMTFACVSFHVFPFLSLGT